MLIMVELGRFMLARIFNGLGGFHNLIYVSAYMYVCAYVCSVCAYGSQRRNGVLVTYTNLYDTGGRQLCLSLFIQIYAVQDYSMKVYKIELKLYLRVFTLVERVSCRLI